MPDVPTSAPIESLYLWMGGPHEQPEHLLMMLTDGDAQSDGDLVYRPLMAVSIDHADQLRDLAQQAADGLGVPAVLREYRLRVDPDAPGSAPIALDVLEPRT